MLRTTFFAASMVICLGSGASAAGITLSSFVNDTAFNAICSLGTTNNQECEAAIAEFRSGGTTSYQQSLNTPTQFGAVTANFQWTNSQIESFDLSHDGNGLLSLTLAGQTIDMPNPTGSYDGLAGANAMFIRVRNVSETDRLSLTDMVLNGMAIGDLAFGDLLGDGNTVGAGSAGAGYLRIDGFDFSQVWSLTGGVALSWAGSLPSQSNLNANFKIAEIPTSPIPLPAAVWLLMGGVGILGGLRRFRRS